MTRFATIAFAACAVWLPVSSVQDLHAGDAVWSDASLSETRAPAWLPELVSLRPNQLSDDAGMGHFRFQFCEQAQSRFEVPDPIGPLMIRAAGPDADELPLHHPVLRSGDASHRLVGLGLPQLPRFFGHVRAEYADDFENQTRAGGRAHLRTGMLFDFDLEAYYRVLERERRADDELWTGDFNVVYQLAHVQRLSFRTGLGVAWVHDEQDAKVGFNATWAADFYVKQPWLMSLELDLGRIESKSLLHARGTIGYVFGQLELYTGWDYYELGDRAFDGLVMGAGLWF